MASCEMCGKDAGLRSAVIAGSSVMVCSNCSSMDNSSLKTNNGPKTHSFRKHSSNDLELEIPTNYAQIIQQGINKKSLTPHQVARAVNVKESSLSHYLKSQIKPDIAISRKFESFLDIKLVFEVEKSKIDIEDFKVSPEDNDSEVSLGDMLLKELNKAKNK